MEFLAGSKPGKVNFLNKRKKQVLLGRGNPFHSQAVRFATQH
jgi:hypothetical protein